MALRISGEISRCLSTRSATLWTLCQIRQSSVASRGVQPIPNKEPIWMTAEEAVSHIKSGMRVYVQSSAATPFALVQAMTQHGLSNKLRDIEVIHMQTEGKAEYAQPECQGIFRSSSVFIGENVRKAINDGRGDFIPVFLSEVPLLFRRGILPIDVALVTLSVPDEHGFCTLGTSVDTALAAVQTAKIVIGQVNSHMPRVFGQGLIHISQLDMLVKADVPLPEISDARRTPSELDERIGRILADNLIEDGATLQLGIGRIPHAVLSRLKNRRDLGIHSEMISDTIIQLFISGQCTNARKTIQQGKIVGSFAYGSRKLYDFMHNNPAIWLGDASYVARTAIIDQNPKMTSINTCLEVDLTGQVCSDSLGVSMYTGVGGQIDFMRGAALGHDGQGKAIIALQSLAPRGESKIVPFLKTGAGVVTTRAHVHYIVTEYGIAYLFGKTLRQRAYELIRIANPKYRESLEKAAFERLRIMPSP